MNRSEETLKYLKHTLSLLDKQKKKYEINDHGEDVTVQINQIMVMFSNEGIIITEEDILELCYYHDEFESSSDLFFYFKRDLELVLKGAYPPNKSNLIDKVFVNHFKPDPFSKNNTLIKVVVLIVVVGFIVRLFLQKG